MEVCLFSFSLLSYTNQLSIQLLDACKFMHDRGDYKTGWQLEREWDEQQKIKAIERASGMH